VLRCAGCGLDVSEWAARCPACHHPTGDADEVVVRRWRRARPAALVAAAVVAVLAGARVATGLHAGGPSAGPPPLPAGLRPPALPGRVIASDSTGVLFSVAPDGSGARVLRDRANLPPSSPPPSFPAGFTATSAQLKTYAGQSPATPERLTGFPDPTGQKLAVLLNPMGAEESNSALVVVSRAGRYIASTLPAEGPSQDTVPYWSPDGSAIAFATFGPVGTSLAVLELQDPGRPVVEQSLEPGTSVAGCVWSPDSRWVLCEAKSELATNWVIARNDGRLTPIYSVPARYRPIAWLP
jgi:hypothetical protein